MVSIPSARLQVLGYCTAAPVWLSWLAGWPAPLNCRHGQLLNHVVWVLTRKVAVSDYVCLSHTTEVAALEEDRSILTRCLCWWLVACWCMVSSPSALGARLRLGSGLLYYCTTAPVWLSLWFAAHSPVHMDTDYWWACNEDLTRLLGQRHALYCNSWETLNKDTLVGLYCVHLYPCLPLSSLPDQEE